MTDEIMNVNNPMPASTFRMTIGPYRFPDFLCIGAQKAGTTWLYENLRHAPALWMPPVKELQYFNELYIAQHRDWTPTHRRSHGTSMLQHYLSKTESSKWDYRYIGCLADIIGGAPSDYWYGKIFTLAAASQICGEMTPEYSMLPRSGIAHILGLMPDVKVIFLMRDPIERAWSHLRMLARGWPSMSLERLIGAAKASDVADRGDYPRILDRWEEMIPPERLSIHFVDDIAAKPADVMLSICGFLGIPFEAARFPNLHKPVHVGEDHEMPDQLYEFLKEQALAVYDRMEDRFPEIVSHWRERHFGNAAKIASP